MATFLGPCLINFMGLEEAKISVALSTVEAEYVTAASCCAQILWVLREQLRYFGVLLNDVPIFV